MKKIYLILIYTLSALIIGCSNESENQSEKNINENNSVSLQAKVGKYKIDDLILNPDLIGKIHNEEMDSIYNKLVLLKENKLDRENMNLDEFIEFHILESLKQKIDFSEIENLDQFIIKSDITETNNITSFQNELNSLLDLELTTEQYKINSETIYNEYAKLNSDNAYQVNLKIILSVAVNSNEYWKTNEDKWENLLNSINSANAKVTDRNGRIVRADISGGVRGAVTGGVGGAMAGGIGAVPGALVGGLVSACVSSSATGIREHLGYTSWWPF